MVVRTQPANRLPRSGPAGVAVKGRWLGWLSRVRRRLAFYWLLIAVFLTLCSVGYSANLLRKVGDTQSSGVAFNFAALGIALAFSFTVGLLRPDWWRRAICAAIALPVPLLLGTSGKVAAGATVFALLLPMIWLGREIARALDRAIDPFDAWMIGTAFGVGMLGLLALVLGVTGNLRPQFIWPVSAIVAIYLLVRQRRHLHHDISSFLDWLKRPSNCQPVVLLLTGIALACFWLNLIGALAPEIRTDATRQRLATAVFFAKTGGVMVADPDLNVATAPAFGEITYAVAAAAGPAQSAKLVHWLMGLACAGAIFALGRRLGGRWAGALAAFAFYHMLLVGYLSQTAYLDLIATLFITVSALCLTLGAGAKWRFTVGAGVALGLSVVVKLPSGYVAIGMALIAAILAQRFGWRRLLQHTALLTVAAMLAASPWMARSILLTEALPGLSSATTAIGSAIPGNPLLNYDQDQYGFGRSPAKLLEIPFTFVLLSNTYGGWGLVDAPILGGHIGFLLLGIVPLLLATRLRRRTVAIVGGAIVASIFWSITMQYVRYALPMIALFCSVGGAAYVAVWRNTRSKSNRAALNILLCILALSGTFVTMHLPTTAQQLAFGMQSDDDYLEEWLGTNGAGSYKVLTLLSAEPGATRAFALHDGARLYTDVRVSNPWTSAADLAFTGSDQEVLDRLAAGGYTHIMIDRFFWYGDQWAWDKMTVVNEDFLRRNTALVGGGDYSYLYRILPPEQRGTTTWAAGNELLPDGGFEGVAGNSPKGWTVVGNPQFDLSGTQSHTGNGAVALATRDQLRTEIPVTPNTEYLLAQAAHGIQDYGSAQLSVEWHDANGKVITVSGEKLPISPEGYHTLSMLVTAPTNAATATISLSQLSGRAWFDDFSLRAVGADGHSSQP